jgi:hypothetical protein
MIGRECRSWKMQSYLHAFVRHCISLGTGTSAHASALFDPFGLKAVLAPDPGVSHHILVFRGS